MLIWTQEKTARKLVNVWSAKVDRGVYTIYKNDAGYCLILHHDLKPQRYVATLASLQEAKDRAESREIIYNCRKESKR